MENELILDSLKVQGFRAFEDLQVERLGRVNLITGKNNVGKTALLEALQVYARRGEPNVLQSLLVRRDETFYSNSLKQHEAAKYLEDVKHIFYGRPQLFTPECHFVIGSLVDENNCVAISLKSEEWGGDQTLKFGVSTPGTDQLTLVSADFISLKAGEYSIDLPFAPSYFRNRHILGISDKQIHHTFVWSKGLDNNTLSQWWDSTTLTPAEDEVVKALQIIVPGISRVGMISAREGNSGNPERIPVVRAETADHPLPMKSLGEGLNRMFGLAMAMVTSNGGLLMVDEIETGLHYSVQADMWRLVFKTAKRLGIQVFATTHSSDCIRAFEEAASEDQESEGILIRLENKGGKIRAVPFDERKLSIATREGIEVR